MKKTEQQHDEYNLIRKQVKATQILYRTQMSPFNPRNSKATQITGPNSRRIHQQYSQQSRKSQDKSCSLVVLDKTRRKEIDDSNTKDLSNNPSKFSTMAQLENQIQRLTTQLTIRNGELKEITKNQQKRKGQVIQLQKQVNYYEGRLDIVQNQLKSYQECFLKISKQCDERSKYQSHVQELVSLFQSLRKQNEILNGKYEQKSYQLNKISEKYLRLKEKVRTQYYKKEENINSQLEKQTKRKKTKSSSLFKRVYESANEQKQRQEYIRNLNSKIQEIEGAISQINKQNQRLYKQLEERDEKVNKISKQMKNLKDKISGQRRSRSKSRNKLKFPERRVRKQNEIKVDRSKPTYQEYFPKQQSSVVQQLTIKSMIQDPSSTLFRKIRYNLMCSETKYEQFIQKLSQNDICAETFTKQPYNLKQQQAQELINWRAEVLRNPIKMPIKQSKESTTSGQSSQKQKEKEQNYKILSSRIQKYKNLSLKKQHIIKITIFNTYLNREEQFIEQIMRQRYLDYYSTEEYFKYWGLNNTEVDVILKSFYEETGQIRQVDLQTISNIILRWQKL